MIDVLFMCTNGAIPINGLLSWRAEVLLSEICKVLGLIRDFLRSGQSHLTVKVNGEHLEQVALVPTCFETLALNTAFRGLFMLEQIQGDVPE